MKTSTGDEGMIHPYLRYQFYTLHKFSERMGYTPKARKEFARREKEEAQRLLKYMKEDLL